MDFKVDDDVKAPSGAPARAEPEGGRQDWELQPTDGFSTPAELYLKAVPDDSSSDSGDGEDTYAALQIGDERCLISRQHRRTRKRPSIRENTARTSGS